MSSLYLNRLPENMSGLKITDTAHLLNSVSPTALARAEGWVDGARQVEQTCAAFEAVMDPQARSVSAGTPVANDSRAPQVALAA